MIDKTILELHYSDLENVKYNLILSINELDTELRKSEMNELLINNLLNKINSKAKYLKLLKNDIVFVKNE